MKTINFWRVLILAGLMTLIVIYVILWLGMISSPAERTGADFIVFFTAGRIAQTVGVSHVFDPQWQQAIQQTEVGFPLAPGQVLLFNHLPFLIPILKVLISGNYVASFYRWAVLLLTLYIVGVVLLSGVLQRAGWQKLEVLLAAAGMITFFPLFVSMLNGQDTAIAFLGLCLFLVGFLIGKDWLAGLGLALTSVRPQVTVLLAVPFLFRRQKVFGWFCLVAGVLGLLSLAAVGLEGMRGFLNLLLVSASGEWYGLKEPLMVNLVGVLWRIAPGLGANTIHFIGWVVYGMTLTGLCLLWWRTRIIDEKQIGLAIVLAVFSVPHLHYHDLTLLLVALVAALILLVRGGFLSTQKAALVPLVISIVLLFSNFAQILKLNIPYLVMIFLVLELCFPGFFIRDKKPLYEKQANP